MSLNFGSLIWNPQLSRSHVHSLDYDGDSVLQLPIPGGNRRFSSRTPKSLDNQRRFVFRTKTSSVKKRSKAKIIFAKRHLSEEYHEDDDDRDCECSQRRFLYKNRRVSSARVFGVHKGQLLDQGKLLAMYSHHGFRKIAIATIAEYLRVNDKLASPHAMRGIEKKEVDYAAMAENLLNWLHTKDGSIIMRKYDLERVIVKSTGGNFRMRTREQIIAEELRKMKQLGRWRSRSKLAKTFR